MVPMVRPLRPRSQLYPPDRGMQEAARLKGVQLNVLKAGTEGDIDIAFATLVEVRANAIIVVGDIFFASRREQLVELASRHESYVISASPPVGDATRRSATF